MSQNDEQEAEPNAPTWLGKKLKRIHWRIHATFPNTISSPYGSDAEFFAQHDLEKNHETRLPEDEDIRVNVMWGIETFGPSEIESLYLHLKDLGWDYSPFPEVRRSATEWIKEARTYGFMGKFNIGVVNKKGTSNRPTRYVGPVPKNIDYLLVNIVQVSPTITCVVVGFVLTEEFSRIYSRDLLTDRQTEHRSTFGKFTYQTLGVELLKREAIDKARTQYRELVVDWFGTNLSGYFHATSKGKRLPTTELITSKNTILLRTHEEEIHASAWARLLIPFSWSDVWISARHDELRLRYSNIEGRTPFHTIVCLQTAQLPAEPFEMYGGPSSGAIVAFVHELLEGNLVQNAALAMLHEISRTLTNSREKLRTHGTGYEELLNSIEKIKSFFDQSLGIPVVVADLLKKSNDVRRYEYESHEFLNRPWHPEVQQEKLSEVMRLNTQRISDRLLLEESVAREHFEQIASILSTRESVKTQRRMEYLTVLTIFLAVGSLIISLSPDSWLKSAKAYVENMVKN